MNIRSRRNSDARRIKILLLIVVLTLLAGFILPSAIKFVSGVVLYPVIQVETWFARSNQVLPTLWRDKLEMQTEIDSLTQELSVAGQQDLTRQRLFSENNRLRSLLGATTSARTAAAVLARPGELPYDLLQIDQGSQAGILVGSPVYIGEDTVIGMVSAVQRDTAFVTLFTTPDFLATVYISGANVTATIEGLGGGVARVKVPQGVPLKVGDLIHIPSIQPGVYGKIAWVENEPTQPEQYGYITPETPIASLFNVAVGTPQQIITDATEVGKYILHIEEQQLVVADLVVPSIATSTASTSSASSTSTDDL